MRILRIALLLFGAAMAIVHAADTTVIKAIVVENAGFGQLDPAIILRQLTVKEGGRLNQIDVDRDIKNLLKTGLYADIQAVVDTGADGMVLKYRIINRSRLVEKVRVQGAVRLGSIGYLDWLFSKRNAAERGEGRVREWLELEPGDLVDARMLEARIAKVREEYRKDLFYEVAITNVIVPVDPGAGTVTISIGIDEGPRSGISRFVFEGRAAMPEGLLRKELELPAWWNPFYWYVRQPFNRSIGDHYRQLVQNLYWNEGYLDAAIEMPVADKRGSDVALRIPIKEGPCYLIRAITLNGVSLFTEDDLRLALYARIKPDAIASKVAIENGAKALRDYYESRGYLDTMVDFAWQSSGSRVDLTYNIKPGALTKINMVYVRGNAYTKDNVIRRELLVRPGDTYDGVKVRTSETRVRNLGYFNSVTFDLEKPVGAEDNRRNLVYRVEESGSTGQILVGAGASSIDNIYGFAELSFGNFDIAGWPTFKGGGQKLRLNALAGSTKQEYSITFIEPWFMDRKLSLGIKPYFKKYEYSNSDTNTSYDQEKYGFSVTLGKSIELSRAVDPYGFTKNLRADLTYQLERSEITGSTDTNTYVDERGATVDFGDASTLLSSLQLSISRDMRNDSYMPSRGWKTEVSGTLYGGPFGGEVDMYALEGEASIYYPLPFKHIFGIYAHAKVIDGYNDTETIPLSERIFMYGYDMNVRGFKTRYIGPKAWLNGNKSTTAKAAGGQSLAVVNAEYTMPLIDKVLRLAFFYDVGNVWSEAYDFDLDEIAIGAGVGLRFTVKNFPLRLDYAWDLERDDQYTKTRLFSFSLRYDF